MSNTIETNKRVSQVLNIDCVEYMRTLPDNYFDIAICDPPYGDADSEQLGGGWRFGGIFDRYKQPTAIPRRRQMESLQEATKYPHPINNNKPTGIHTQGGTLSKKYYKEKDGDLKNIDLDVAPQQEFFDELFRVSKNQVIWGGIIFSFHLQDAFSYGENYLFQRSSPWQCVNMRGHHSKVTQNYLSQFHNVESIAENSIQRRNR